MVYFVLSNLLDTAPNNVIYNILKYFPIKNSVLLLDETNSDKIFYDRFSKVTTIKSIKQYDLSLISSNDILFFNDFYTLQYSKNIKKGKHIAIVHSHLENEYKSLKGLTLVQKIKIKIKQKVHELLISKMDYAVAVSPTVHQYIQKLSLNSICITNGIMYEDFPKLQKEKKEKLILVQTGRLIYGKNILYSLKLIKFLIENNIDLEFHLFGSYNEAKKEEKKYFELLAQFIKDNRLKNIIYFHGHVSKDILFSFYQKADILLMPSYVEGMSLALLEANYFKIPAIAFDLSSAKDIIEDNVNGLLVDIYSQNDFDKILKYINEKKYEKNGEKAREKVLEHYDAKIMAKEYKLFCESLKKHV